MASYSVSTAAYLKIILHSIKRPHSNINGILLGAVHDDGNVDVTDALPTLHTWTGLSPMMEAALEMAETYAKSKSLTIVGLYEARKSLDDKSISLSGRQIAETMIKKEPKSLVLVVDGEKLPSGQPALVPYIHPSATWEAYSFSSTSPSSSTFRLVDNSAANIALRAARDGVADEKLADFDDHLMGIWNDWLGNPGINVSA